ncbi:sensor domain-containing protein [Noviherbaspirillum massiliense]|uniref:sensor domain-containing protein n=1 Tax=Noviherbaspirillum massiliense TaxID=1465823 RepID=UPI0013763642|nr:EAL domain-containing protein [Noviherbaspirillum massiliense]
MTSTQSRTSSDTPASLFPEEWQALTEMLGGSDAGMIFLQNGLIARVNDELAERLGFDQRELVGRHVASLFPAANTSAALSNNPLQSLTGEDGRIVHVALVDRQGNLAHFNLMVHRLDNLPDVKCTIWVLQPAPRRQDMHVPSPKPIPPLVIRRLQAIVENFPDLVCICDPDSRFRFANPSFKDILGYSEEELIGVRALDLVHKDDRHRLRATFKRALRLDLPAPPEPTVFRARHRDRSWRHLAAHVRNLSAKGTVSGLLVCGRDVTWQQLELQKRSQEYRRQLHYVSQLFRLAQRPPTDFSMALKTILKTSAKTLGAHRCAYWTAGDDPDSVRCVLMYDDVKQNFSHQDSVPGPGLNCHPLLHEAAVQGRPLVVDDVDQDARTALYCEYFHAAEIKALLLMPVRQDGVLLFAQLGQAREWRKDEAGFAASAAEMIALASQEARRSKTEAQLRRMVQRGKLEGLPERHVLYEHAEEIFPQLASRSAALAVFFVDLDGFRSLLESLGETAADQLLKAAALRLKNLVRNDDVLARMGRDKFMLVARDLSDARLVEDLAQQIVEAMRSPFLLDGRMIDITASVGIALYPFDGTEIDVLMKKADLAMYRAKSSGRDRYRLSTPVLEKDASSRPALENDLRKALESGALQHHYQPQIDLRTGKVCCVEAFLRWQHPQYGLLLPAHFLPVAERAGLLPALNRWAVDDICAQFQAWRARGLDEFNIALNLSTAQLMDRQLMPMLEDRLADCGIPGLRLEWEVSESTVMHGEAMTAALLDRLTEKEIGLSIDDFGTGSSSLTHLRRFPVHKVKIDTSFVSGLPAHDDDCAIIDAIISMAQPLGLDVVAEGVETRQQLDYLRDRGCDIAQGYYFTQPLSPPQFEKWLTRH